MSIAATQNEEYYAVIFTSIIQDNAEGYSEMARKMEELAALQNGYLGMESARESLGITVSYWKTEQDIKNWKEHLEHLVAQKMGQEKWYKNYAVRVCKMERQYFYTV